MDNAQSGNGTLVLASKSPRRRELLEAVGREATVIPIGVDEAPLPGEPAEAVVRRLSLAKARQAAAVSPGLALGADTIVVEGDRLLGKPGDTEQAKRMLESLAGRNHRVLTAVALVDNRTGGEVVEVCETEVPMRAYGGQEIEAYIASGAPFDKAGGYGIQDDGFRPVALERLQGCYANVMGLPLCHLARALRRLGENLPVAVPEACRLHTGYDCRIYPSILEAEA
ncbi:MAG: Maf family protein [Chloroflexota bacterium]